MSVKLEVELSDAVAAMVENQVASGRYANISSAVQDAAWHHFVRDPSIFDEYGVTPKEVARSARKDLERIAKVKKKGGLKPWP